MAFLGIKEPSLIWSDDLFELSVVFSCSFAFFWLTYYLSQEFMNKQCKANAVYHALKSGQKADFLSRIVANVHAVLSCIAAVISYYGEWYAINSYSHYILVKMVLL